MVRTWLGQLGCDVTLVAEGKLELVVLTAVSTMSIGVEDMASTAARAALVAITVIDCSILRVTIDCICAKCSSDKGSSDWSSG